MVYDGAHDGVGRRTDRLASDAGAQHWQQHTADASGRGKPLGLGQHVGYATKPVGDLPPPS